MNRITTAAIAATFFALASCGGGSDDNRFSSGSPTPFPQVVQVSAAFTTVEPGWTVPLEARVGSVSRVTGMEWASSDTSIAVIDRPSPDPLRAVARMIGAGKVTITATTGAASATVELNVVPKVGDRSLSGVIAGMDHTCAPSKNSPPVCWGSNSHGQLGDGTTVDRATPVTVSATWPATNLSVGALFTCSVGIGFNEHTTYCWGDNSVGQFGNGTIASLPVLSPIPGRASDGGSSPGARHGCAYDWEFLLRCWGDNGSGQLGDGTTITKASAAVVLGVTPVWFYPSSAGQSHTCGLETESGRAHCWGSNASGQLGDGTTTTRLTRVPVAGGLQFAIIDAGDRHTCALTSSRVAYCWGDNTMGQLGAGALPSSSTPMLVAGGIGFASVEAGATHTCGVTTAGAAYCWGSNSAGQLGDGTTVSRASPSAVLNGLNFKSLALGDKHTCGLTIADLVYCWGSNARGQLGDGTNTDSATPVKVSGQL